MSIKPWWIVTILSGEGDISNESFKDQLDNQLLIWSKVNKIISSNDVARWWTVDSFCHSVPANENELVEHIDKFLYDPLRRKNGQEPRIGGDIDGSQLTVAIVGDIRNKLVLTYFHCLGRMLRFRQTQVFEGRTLKILAFLYLPQGISSQVDAETNQKIVKFLTELHTMMEHETVSSRPFDFIFIFQDSNNMIDNPQGYTALTEKQVSELMIQSLFHLMISESDVLNDLCQMHSTHYLSMGAVAIYYDWQKHRRMLAKQLGEDLLDKFKSSDEEPFINDNQARQAIENVEHETTIRNLFNRLTLGEGRPSFSFNPKIWEGARDHNGEIISPWALHRKELLYFYFLVHLRQLPLRLSEYTQLFLRSSIQQFRDFLRLRRLKVWDGSPEHGEQGIRDVMLDTVRNVLKGKFSNARSIEQVKKVLEEMKKICNTERVTSALSEIDDFQRFTAFEVPNYLRDFYDQASDNLDEEREAKLYDRLVDTLRAHPIPLALLLRALLIALLCAFLGDRFFNLLSPEIVDLEWLLQVPGLAMIILWIIPLAIAFWRYQVRTLNEVQKRIKMYVAAALRHVQNKAKELVKLEISALLDQAQEYCDQIEEYMEKLKGKLSYPESNTESYISTTFQRDILGTLEIPGRGRPLEILPEKPKYEITILGQKKPFDKIDDQEKNLLLNSALNQQAQNAEKYMWELLCDGIPDVMSEESAKRAMELLQEFTEKIYEEIEVCSLHSILLNSSAREHIEEVIREMKCFCFPPAVLSQGVMDGISVSYEWKYDNCNHINDIINSDRCSNIPGSSILSLSAYRPIKILSDIATVHAMGESVNLNEVVWQDASSTFTVATTRFIDSKGFVLKSALNGDIITITDTEIQDRVKKLRESLGIEHGGVIQYEI